MVGRAAVLGIALAVAAMCPAGAIAQEDEIRDPVSNPNPDPDPVPDADPNPVPVLDPVPEPDPDLDPDPDPDPDSVPDPVPEPDPVPDPDPVLDPDSVPDPVPEPDPVPDPDPEAATDAVAAVSTYLRSAEYRDGPPPGPLTSEVWFWAAIVAATVGVFLTVLVDVTTDDPSPSSVGSMLTLSWP